MPGKIAANATRRGPMHRRYRSDRSMPTSSPTTAWNERLTLGQPDKHDKIQSGRNCTQSNHPPPPRSYIGECSPNRISQHLTKRNGDHIAGGVERNMIDDINIPDEALREIWRKSHSHSHAATSHLGRGQLSDIQRHDTGSKLESTWR